MAFQHANYAMAYLNLARQLALDNELTDVTQIPVDDLREDIERQEASARERILQLCPQVGAPTRAAKNAGFAGRGIVTMPAQLPAAPQQQQFIGQYVQPPSFQGQGPMMQDQVRPPLPEPMTAGPSSIRPQSMFTPLP